MQESQRNEDNFEKKTSKVSDLADDKIHQEVEAVLINEASTDNAMGPTCQIQDETCKEAKTIIETATEQAEDLGVELKEDIQSNIEEFDKIKNLKTPLQRAPAIKSGAQAVSNISKEDLRTEK